MPSMLVAQQDRCDGDEQLVDQSLGEIGTEQGRAALDEDLDPPASRSGSEQRTGALAGDHEALGDVQRATTRDHPDRLTPRESPARSRGELRSISLERPPTDDDGVDLGSKSVPELSRSFLGDPLRLPPPIRDGAVEAAGDLADDEGAPAQPVREVRGQVVGEPRAHRPGRESHLDPSGLQGLDPSTSHPWIWIDEAHLHTCHARLDDRIDAGRRAAMVGAGLERHAHLGAASQGTGRSESGDLGVGTPGMGRPADADHHAIALDHRTDPRVWRCDRTGATCEPTCTLERSDHGAACGCASPPSINSANA